MRFTASVLAGFVAVSVATPGSPAYKPDPAIVSTVTILSHSTETTPIDGNWHIGCDEKNYCSYYQGKDLTPESTAKKLARSIALSETTCQQCDSKHPCDHCLPTEFDRDCRDCDHYECYDAFHDKYECLDLQPELSDFIRNHTEVSTVVETVIETEAETSTISVFVVGTTTTTETTTSVAVETTTSTTVQTAITLATWTVEDEPIPTTLSSTMIEEPESLPTTSVTDSTTLSSTMPEEPSLRMPTLHEQFSDTIASTVTLGSPSRSFNDVSHETTTTRTITLWGGVATPSVHRSNRRDQGTEIGADTLSPIRRRAAFTPDQCTPCDHISCPECYADCHECERYRCDDIATHLSVCMSLRAKWQPPGFNVSASSSMETTTIFIPSMPTPIPIPMVPAYTSIVYSYLPAPPMHTSTVVVYPPGPSSTTTVVVAYPQAPSVSTETVYVPQPSPPVVEVTYTEVIMGPAPVVSTVYVGVPTKSPVVVEIPVNMESTITRTMPNAARATREPAPLSRRQTANLVPACIVCEHQEICNVCTFDCPGCHHLFCENPSSGEGICVQIDPDIDVKNAHQVFKPLNSLLDHTTRITFSIRGDGDNLIPGFNGTEMSDTPPLSMILFDSTDDCSVCSPGDEACGMCDFRFACGFKGQCSSDNPSPVTLCYEVGEQCPA